MNQPTEISKLADRLHIPRSEMNQETLISTTAHAASQRIEQLENKLSGAIAMATTMAQELQEIIADAEQAGSTLPVTSEIVDLWEAIYAEQNLIDEVTL